MPPGLGLQMIVLTWYLIAGLRRERVLSMVWRQSSDVGQRQSRGESPQTNARVVPLIHSRPTRQSSMKSAKVEAAAGPLVIRAGTYRTPAAAGEGILFLYLKVFGLTP